MGSMRQPIVPQLVPANAHCHAQQAPCMAPGGMLPDSQVPHEAWHQHSQAEPQGYGYGCTARQLQLQPSFSSPTHPSPSPMRFRSAFARQQVARSQSPLNRLSQRSFSRPTNYISLSQEDSPSETVRFSQQPSQALLHPPSMGMPPGYVPHAQQPPILSQANPGLRSTQQQVDNPGQDLVMYQDSQNNRPASATHYGARPVSSSTAAQGGSDAASATAAKLLDQIGQVSSLQRQMTQLTAEVKKTTEACAGIADIAHDVKVLTASLRNIEDIVKTHTGDCAAAAGKADQLVQTLQDACMQAISDMQRLSAQVSATLPAHEQQLQCVSKAGRAEHSHAHRSANWTCLQTDICNPVAGKPAPAAPLQVQPQPQEAYDKPTASKDSAAMAGVQGQRRRVTRSMARTDHGSNKSVHQPSDTPECSALQPTVAFKRTEKRRRALAEHKCKQSTPKPEETPQHIQDTTPDLQATPWQTKASARKPVTQRAKAGTQASQAENPFKRHCTPSKTAADSSTERQASPSCPSPAPSLKLTLAPLQPSSMHNKNRAVPEKQSAPPSRSGTAAITHSGARAGPLGRRLSSSTGLDVFAKLFARADAEPSDHIEGLPEIKEEHIAKEISKRMMMQRMRHMRI